MLSRIISFIILQVLSWRSKGELCVFSSMMNKSRNRMFSNIIRILSVWKSEIFEYIHNYSNNSPFAFNSNLIFDIHIQLKPEISIFIFFSNSFWYSRSYRRNGPSSHSSNSLGWSYKSCHVLGRNQISEQISG